MTTVPPRSGGKGKSSRPAANQQKASARRQARRRRNRNIGIGAIAIAVAAAVVLVVILMGGNSSSPLRTPASPAQAQAITSVPMSTLVGALPEANRLVRTCVQSGACSNTAVVAPSGSGYPTTLAKNGKPTLLYIGAEFCPICATERWAMIVAMSHFGTFTGLKTTHSAVDDGNIPTWSFYGSTFTSQYLNFETYEVQTNTRATLENPPADIVKLWQGFYAGQEDFPFIDFDQKYVFSTEQVSDQTLMGKTFPQILSAVGNNNDQVGVQIDAAAAVFTRYLCGMTNNQPADVCSAVSSLPNTVTANPNGPNSNSTGSTGGSGTPPGS